jgi:hypothetical protein
VKLELHLQNNGVMPDLFFTGEIKNENLQKFQSFNHQKLKKKEKLPNFCIWFQKIAKKKVDD